jgi:hypothetical protein
MTTRVENTDVPVDLTASKPSTVLVDTYGAGAPVAAKFGRGATSLAEIQQATDARRDLSNAQSTTTTGRVRRDTSETERPPRGGLSEI